MPTLNLEETIKQIQDDIATGAVSRSQVDQWMWDAFQEAIEEEDGE